MSDNDDRMGNENDKTKDDPPSTSIKRPFNIAEAQKEGMKLKQAKTGGGAAKSDTLSSPNSVNGTPYSIKGKAENKLLFWEFQYQSKTYAVLIGGRSVGITGALKGTRPYNANGVFIENPLLSSYQRYLEVLEHEIITGDTFLKENYPGAPSLKSILGPFKHAMGIYNILDFSIRSSSADTDPALETIWNHQVAELKAMVLANRYTIRVEPTQADWLGRQDATWNVLEVSEDTSQALMLYREWKWTQTGQPPRSAHPSEIAAREALQF